MSDEGDGAPRPGSRFRRVLVVEDDPGLSEAIGRLARSSGAEVWQAQTLDEALRLLERTPDLVLADLRLAGRSSLPLIQAALRRRPAPAVVAMSGQASAEESFRLGELGVRAYLAKPFSAEDLIAAAELARREPPAAESARSGADGSHPVRAPDEGPEPAAAPGVGARLLRAARRAAARARAGRRGRSPRRGPPSDAGG